MGAPRCNAGRVKNPRMSTVHTLCASITPFIQHDVILSKLISFVPHLGIGSRKVLLGLCQTEENAEERGSISNDLQMIRADIDIRGWSSPSLYDLEQSILHVSARPIYRAFIAMVVRNEALDRFSQAEDVISDGFLKEFTAGQKRKDEEMRISYQVFDQSNFVPAAYSIFYPIAPRWSGYAKNLVTRFSTRLSKLRILFPHVQRKKNMSRDTCKRLYDAGYTDGDRQWTDFRTLDLELHKYRTGESIQGNCEMRSAWKFNELKPRFYYCTGGTMYWRTRYMKRIAVELMESINSSRLDRRQHPEDIQYALQEDDYLTLWDYSSFTTSLSELKYFLYYIAKNLEEDFYTQTHPLEVGLSSGTLLALLIRYQVLDYQLGIQKVTADKLLLGYNQDVNVEAPFSVWRVCEKIFQAYEDDGDFVQKNSGMLGVHGNIGFSTAHHAIHLEAGAREGTGCALGDDALGGTTEHPRERFIPHLQLLGDIAEEKATIFPPLSLDNPEQVSKFIKRRFTRNYDGIQIGLLLAFPGLAHPFGVRDQYHTNMEDDMQSVISRFICQVGSFLWDVHQKGYLDDDEDQLIRTVLGAVYRRFRLSPSGSLPGIKHSNFNDRMMLSVPPLDIPYWKEDWAEALWSKAPQRLALLPMSLGPTALPPYENGLQFQCQTSAVLNALEDVGCVEKTRMLTEWVTVDETNRRLYRASFRNSSRSYHCVYLKSCPSWIGSFVSDMTVPSVEFY